MDRERTVPSRVSAFAIASHGTSCSTSDLGLQLKETGECNVSVPSISGETLAKVEAVSGSHDADWKLHRSEKTTATNEAVQSCPA